MRADLFCRQILQEVLLLLWLAEVDAASGQGVRARGRVARPYLHNEAT